MLVDGSIQPVQNVSLRHVSHAHPYHEKYVEEARLNWSEEVKRLGALFDGNVMLFDEVILENDNLSGTCHSIPYSTYLHWRKNQTQMGYHLFAIGLMISKEGYPILGKMGAKTYHAGKVYPPSGSLDDDDLVNGVVDFQANIAREIQEETGQDVKDFELEDEYFLYVHGTHLILIRRCFTNLTAQEMCDQINQFIAHDAEPELEEVFAISQKGSYHPDLAPHVPKILDWHFDLLNASIQKTY